MEIIIKGIAGKTEYENLKDLDGIDCPDCFSDYFDKTSYSKDVTGGYMDFVYENDNLYTRTIYNSTRKLTEDELISLGDYTQGQWSDGIGECFEQFPITINDEDVYLSPWYFGQELTFDQIEN